MLFGLGFVKILRVKEIPFVLARVKVKDANLENEKRVQKTFLFLNPFSD